MEQQKEANVPVENIEPSSSGGLGLITGPLRVAVAVSRDVAEASLALAESQVDAAIRVSERFRDEVVAPDQRARVRETGLTAQFRNDAHRVIDVVADVGGFVLATAMDSFDRLIGLEKGGRKRSGGLASLTAVEGIGETYAQRLAEAGVHTQAQLLETGATRQGRDELAEKSGISAKRILTWVNHIDLSRIDGVSEEYADLLEASGVDSVPELARRNPENLYQRLVEVNKEQKRVRRLPSQSQVTDWVAQAGQLPRVVSH